MKTLFHAKLAALFFAFSSALHAATIFTDNAGNYTTESWITGSNGGTGFGAWTITVNSGTGSAGSFIGDPSAAEITGMSSTSFGLYANPVGSGAFVDAGRSFANPLGVGDSFSFQWGINWDSNGGNKGFSLYSGATELINVNNAGTSDITINASNINFGYGTAAMTWSFTLTSATNLQVDATDRDGVGTYSGNFTISGAPDSFKFYASQLDNSFLPDNRQPYFNNLSLTVVPEPSSLSLLALSGLALLRRQRA
ncbi:MAG: hypothetical protein RLY69_494 [Verrucomicrobiota bacterium]